MAPTVLSVVDCMMAARRPARSTSRARTCVLRGEGGGGGHAWKCAWPVFGNMPHGLARHDLRSDEAHMREPLHCPPPSP